MTGLEQRRILVSENEGKIHTSWAMLPDTLSVVAVAMRQLIEWEIQQSRHSVIARKRCDSLPTVELDTLGFSFEGPSFPPPFASRIDTARAPAARQIHEYQ